MNYEILSMIYRLYTRDGLSDTLDKDDIHFALMRYFQTHVFDDLEDENGISINNASIREKARIKVRQFKKAGWLEEDNTEGFRTTIGLNDCALAMLELFDEIFHFLIRRNISLEVNTGGMQHGLSEPNPSYELLQRYYDLGGRMITLGADSHTTANVGLNFPGVVSDLKKIGFKGQMIYRRRNAEFNPF